MKQNFFYKTSQIVDATSYQKLLSGGDITKSGRRVQLFNLCSTTAGRQGLYQLAVSIDPAVEPSKRQVFIALNKVYVYFGKGKYQNMLFFEPLKNGVPGIIATQISHQLWDNESIRESIVNGFLDYLGNIIEKETAFEQVVTA